MEFANTSMQTSLTIDNVNYGIVQWHMVVEQLELHSDILLDGPDLFGLQQSVYVLAAIISPGMVAATESNF